MGTRVAAVVIQRDGRLLVCRRPAHKQHGNLWEFPGGKLEEGETLECAVARELNEELALTATKIGAVLYKVQDAETGFTIEFVAVDACGEAKLLEHQECAWLTVAQIMELPLAPGDRRFVEHFRLQYTDGTLDTDCAPGRSNPDAIR